MLCVHHNEVWVTGLEHSVCIICVYIMEESNNLLLLPIQWNLSVKDTLNKGNFSNEDTICSPNHIELCKIYL